MDGAVVFPHNIGLGAMRDPGLVEKAGRITALEMAGTGIRWAFAPCVAVARDERWGRTYESFGENPELAEANGAAAIRGLQGSSLAESTSVLACAKHYMGDGGTSGGVDQGNTECDEATLRKIHLPGYISAVKAGVGSVMASYSRWNGVKMHGNHHLLTELLKKELGFRGFIVSDWAAIDQLSGDYKTAIEKSINAGIDMVMIPNGPGQRNSYVDFITLLKELVNEGKVPQSRIDDAARRILLVKARMHLADHPFSDPALTSAVGSAEHRQVARECVRKSLVLLKNEKGALPLSKQAKRLVVAGPAADDLGIQCGGWTITWQGKTGQVTRGGTTILAGLRQAVGADTAITHSADGSGATGADAVLVVIGERPYAEMKGDSKDLSLPPEDLAVLKKAKEAGVPVVTVVLSGRPVLLGPVLESSDAVDRRLAPGHRGPGRRRRPLRRCQTHRQAPPYLAAVHGPGAVQRRGREREGAAVSLWIRADLLAQKREIRFRELRVPNDRGLVYLPVRHWPSTIRHLPSAIEAQRLSGKPHAVDECVLESGIRPQLDLLGACKDASRDRVAAGDGEEQHSSTVEGRVADRDGVVAPAQRVDALRAHQTRFDCREISRSLR